MSIKSPDPSSESSSSSDSGSLPINTLSDTQRYNTLIEALYGRAVPACLTESKVGCVRELIATIRGVRYSQEFASDPAIIALCSDDKYPSLKRSRTARLIMSNKIPDIDVANPDNIPYCIWHPGLAEEGTYRELVKRYPEMKYQVGRACAVAGYTDLFMSLNLLPDVSIAEEARDNNNYDIFNSIMSHPVRYAVMDDYTRAVNLTNARSPAFLNADTSVRSHLDRKIEIEDIDTYNLGITEDGNIDEDTVYVEPASPTSPDVMLLYSPLPLDLPAFEKDKDTLILMAAYDGNIDRYSRLRRPYRVEGETACIVRGIYHHSSFAKWWETEIEKPKQDGYSYIVQAIAARSIMDNNINYVRGIRSIYLLPYLIWYPKTPSPPVLRQLSVTKPGMRMQIAQACIACDFRELYDELKVTPHRYLWEEASRSENQYYLKDLEMRAKQMDINLQTVHQGNLHGGEYVDTNGEYIMGFAGFGYSSTQLPPGPDISSIRKLWTGGEYNSISVTAASLELFISAPTWVKIRAHASQSIIDIRDQEWDEEEHGEYC
jgi:hypothetical protein